MNEPSNKPKPEWIENNAAHPFWKSKVAVEVTLKDGRIEDFGCPRCAQGMMREVVKWRPLGALYR